MTGAVLRQRGTAVASAADMTTPEQPVQESTPHVLANKWSPDRVRTLCLVILASIAVVAALWAGRDVFVPLAMAAAFAAVLRPVVAWLRDRMRLPAPVGGALVLLALLGALVAIGAALEQPARDWAVEAPQLFARARTRLETLRRPLDRMTRAINTPTRSERVPGSVDSADARDVERPSTRQTEPSNERSDSTPRAADLTASTAEAGPTTGSVSAIPGVPPSALGGAVERLFGTTAGLLASTAEVLLLLYFLLAGDDRFLRRLVGGLSDTAAKRAAVEVVRESEAHVSRYLGTLLLISTGQGAVVALALWALGTPSPLLWGLATVVLETLPYLGAAIMVSGLAIVGLASGGSLAAALAPPATYLLVSTLQTSFVSPIAYGRRLRLNPFAILVAVLAGYALWGVAGVFLAVPAAASLNVLAEHIEALRPVGAVLRE